MYFGKNMSGKKKENRSVYAQFESYLRRRCTYRDKSHLLVRNRFLDIPEERNKRLPNMESRIPIIVYIQVDSRKLKCRRQEKNVFYNNLNLKKNMQIYICMYIRYY